MTGWRDPQMGLWQFPLTNQVENEVTDTKLMSADKTDAIVDEIAAHVQDLPSTEHAI